MHHYTRRLSDSMSNAHLSMIEHGAYTLLLDQYYATEQPLPTDIGILCRILRASGKPEMDAIKAVLDQFWKKQLESLSSHYLFRINSLLGAPMVSFIEFRLDRDFVLKARGHEARGYEFHHTEELTEELKESAQEIKDPELRETFLRAAAKSLERKESDQ